MYIYNIRANELFKNSLRRGGNILIFVDGKKICTIAGNFSESQAGIIYNGILLYNIPEN